MLSEYIHEGSPFGPVGALAVGVVPLLIRCRLKTVVYYPFVAIGTNMAGISITGTQLWWLLSC